MIQALKNNIVMIVMGVVLALTAAVAVPVTSHAQTKANPQQAVCSGANNLELTTSPGAGQCQANSTATTGGLNNLIAKIINVFSVLVGVVAVVMIIYGGFRYITSGGDSNNIGTAKNTILYAIIGLIIVALAQLIVKFVLGSAATV
jgi:hypothetical protein